MHPSFRAVDQTHAEWQTFEKLENKRQMYGSQASITNFDTLFLVMGLISLVDEVQFMLISSRHICIRSIAVANE